MRLPSRLSALDWKYAIRELVLIIVGILIALWVNNWNTSRHQRRAELGLLREIRSSLAADLTTVQSAAENLRLSEQRSSSLRDHVRKQLPYADSLDVLFGSAYGFRLGQINTAPYEALETRGLDLITDDSLRLAIIRVYETGAAAITRADEINTNVSFEVLRPYYLARFRDIQFLEHATPHNYTEVVRDPYFHNLLDYRLTVLGRGVLPRYERTAGDMSRLIDAIDRELSRRE